MVTEALQFWYDRQEKGKVAFRFKSFLEGKGLREAPPRKKVKVHTVGKAKKQSRRSIGQRKSRAEMELESGEAMLRKKAEEPEDDENDSWGDSDVERPTKKGTQQYSQYEDSSDDGSFSSSGGEAKLTTEAGSDDIPESRQLKQKQSRVETVTAETSTKRDRELQKPPVTDTHATSDWDVMPGDSYWEADLGCSGSTNVIQSAMGLGERGTKRKCADGDALPSKNPRLDTGYKLGPRNGRPGKIKKTPALSVVQDPGKGELFKPELVTLGKTSKQQSEVDPQAGPPKLFNFDFTKSSDGIPVKPKPKPRPIIKGKLSGELGIVTRDRSKRIAQESVRSTRSKKL